MYAVQLRDHIRLPFACIDECECVQFIVVSVASIFLLH